MRHKNPLISICGKPEWWQELNMRCKLSRYDVIVDCRQVGGIRYLHYRGWKTFFLYTLAYLVFLPAKLFKVCPDIHISNWVILLLDLSF